MIAEFDHIGSADSASDPAHRLISGDYGSHYVAPAGLMLDTQRQRRSDDHRAGMANRTVMSIIKLHTMRGAGVNQGSHIG